MTSVFNATRLICRAALAQWVKYRNDNAKVPTDFCRLPALWTRGKTTRTGLWPTDCIRLNKALNKCAKDGHARTNTMFNNPLTYIPFSKN